ncbi:MAG: ATP synthase protein I [Patiriisocius sp.]
MSFKIESIAYQIVLVQFGATILIAFLCLFVDWVAAYSVLLGGLTGAVPSAFMAWRFGSRQVADVGLAFSHLLRGEIGKLLLTAALFTACFGLVEPLSAGFYFAALGATLMCNLLVPLITASR